MDKDVPCVIVANILNLFLDNNADLAKVHRIAKCVSVKNCETNFKYLTYCGLPIKEETRDSTRAQKYNIGTNKVKKPKRTEREDYRKHLERDYIEKIE